MATTIRACVMADLPAVEAVYPAAFPVEDLVLLVRALFAEGDGFGLVANADGRLAGHMALSQCWVAGEAKPPRPAPVALLGPLAVVPSYQRRGIGSALIRTGIQRLRDEGYGSVLVLGDPAYCGRFGFQTEQAIQAPFPLPDEWADAWQSLHLHGDGAHPSGTLQVPAPWHDRALWAP